MAAKLRVHCTVRTKLEMRQVVPGGTGRMNYQLRVTFMAGAGATRESVENLLAAFLANYNNRIADPEQLVKRLHETCQRTVAGLHSVSVDDGSAEYFADLDLG